MKEHPILFNTEMVKAVLDGRKTQTRRAVKNIKPESILNLFGRVFPDNKTLGAQFHQRHKYGDMTSVTCPYGQVGDHLWVRETFKGYHRGTELPPKFFYRASNPDACPHLKWTPSIHMPRFVSRITLEIVNIRIERVQDITEEDSKAEGIKEVGNCSPPNYDYDAKQYYIARSLHETARDAFKYLWDSIYKNWKDNPWVWIVEFKRI